MIKVAIVDDEVIFRTYLKTTIDWANYGFEICFEAKNGVDALNQMENIKIDIILCDINMPFMDGLELSEKVKEKYPQIVIILITGYNEFEYAKKAIKIGVKDYILKPFEKTELLNTMISVKEKIISDIKSDIYFKNDIILKRETLYPLFMNDTGEYNDEEIINTLAKYDIKLKTKLFRTAAIEIDSINRNVINSNRDRLIIYDVNEILNKAIDVEGNHLSFYDYNGRIISIIESGSKNNLYDFDEIKYNKFINTVNNTLNYNVSVGLGEIHGDFKGIYKSYKEAVAALNNKFILGLNKVIKFDYAADKSFNSGFYASNINENILIGLRLGEGQKIKDELIKVFNYIYENKVSMDYSYAIAMGLVSVCLSYVVEIGYDIEDIYGADFNPLSSVRNIKTINELSKFINDLFDKMLDYSTKNKITKSKKLVKDAKEYIDKNYSDKELNIEKIANSLYINSSYLRSQFKKELKLTILDYITKIRMQKAEEILKTKNIKYSLVSDMIGYSDASYFSKCFKRYFGITPSEYENRKNG